MLLAEREKDDVSHFHLEVNQCSGMKVNCNQGKGGKRLLDEGFRNQEVKRINFSLGCYRTCALLHHFKGSGVKATVNTTGKIH